MTAYTVGPCAADTICKVYDRRTKQPGDAEQHTLCDPCLRAGTFAAAALPRDWVDLEQLLPPGANPTDGPGGARAEAPIPLNVNAEALQRSIWWVTTTWEEILRDHRDLSEVPRRRDVGQVRRGYTVDHTGQTRPYLVDRLVEHPSALTRRMRPGPVDVQRASVLLAAHLPAVADLPVVELATYPLADDEGLISYRPGWLAVHDLIALHQRASAMLGLTRPVRHLPGVCGCGAEELQQDQPRFRGDEQLVYCGGCGSNRSYDEYLRSMNSWEAAA